MVRISNIELVRELMKNSRIPYTELARKFNVSEAAIRKRVERLKDEGIIRKFTVEVNPRKLGFDVVAILGIDVTPERYVFMLNMLKRMEEVVSLHTASGDHMIIMECWFKSSEEFSQFIRKIEGVEGITRVCPAIVIEKVK